VQQSASARLRALLAGPEIVPAPGAYDALSARIVEAGGFPAVYMTGFGSSAGLLGQPDVGLLSQTEMADHARRIAAAVSVPVIADADTGYGNPLNVRRTVQLYEAAGVAALHLEDQVAPKKCGHMEGKQVIAAAEMVQKLRAAAAARRDPAFVIIARTDARAVLGLGEAIRRGEQYAAAGADVLFIEAPESEAECRAIGQAFRGGPPLLFNWAEGGKTPPLSLEQLQQWGYRLVIYPISLLLAATAAMQQLAQAIHRDGTPVQAAVPRLSFAQFNAFIGLPQIQALEREYTADNAAYSVNGMPAAPAS
jgi:2-methylisocitrate lyase-like PEP mutase family enzyme